MRASSRIRRKRASTLISTTTTITARTATIAGIKTIAAVVEIKEEMKEEAEEDKKLSPVTSENNEVTGDFHYITSLMHQAK